MLNKEAVMNWALLKSMAGDLWGDNVVFGEIVETKAPFCEFNSTMTVGKFEFALVYERSTLGFRLKTSDGEIRLHELTDKTIYRGLESFIPENLSSNLNVIDEYIRNEGGLSSE